MSIESAKAFINRLRTDEKFATEISGCKDAQQRIKLANSEGFTFTADEIKTVSEQLTEEELGTVTGGSDYWWTEPGWCIQELHCALNGTQQFGLR